MMLLNKYSEAGVERPSPWPWIALSLGAIASYVFLVVLASSTPVMILGLVIEIACGFSGGWRFAAWQNPQCPGCGQCYSHWYYCEYEVMHARDADEEELT